MIIKKFPTASQAEIDRLKSLIKKVDTVVKPSRMSITKPTPEQPAKKSPGPAPRPAPKDDLFNGGIANVEVTRDAIDIDNPVELLLILRPDFTPYKWQFETLMQFAGYLTHGRYSPADKTPITQFDPFKLLMPAANGSGKDMVLIAAAAVWFALVKARNRVVITSSSFDQTKFQTEPHIRDLVTKANKKFGTLFRSTQFHHVCPELGSEIKLFATDDAGKAEGFHPFDGGDMMIIVNEAKSVNEDIYDALFRCTGYSHWLEISSPGPRAGFMFRHVNDAICYPAPAQLNKYYFRRVTAFDCPHLSKAHIEFAKQERGENSAWYRSSILAEFSDFDISNVITEAEFDACVKTTVKPAGDDIAIGLDLAAGGDENACFVRKGNEVIHSFFFRNFDTEQACLIIDKQLEPWKFSKYIFRADNGGIGYGMIDKLTNLGWRIARTNNQSPANNKREFLNLGAEMWFHAKRLVQTKAIILPAKINKLREQLTSRLFRGLDTTQGKYALESKQEAKASGRPSPDRADAFVLCFASYFVSKPRVEEKSARELIGISELLRRAQTGELWRVNNNVPSGTFTHFNGKI